MKMNSVKNADGEGKKELLAEESEIMPALKGMAAIKANMRLERGPATATSIIAAGDLLLN